MELLKMYQHMKRKFVSILFCIGLCVPVFSADLYKGIVVPLSVDQVKYGTNLGYRGIIKYIAEKGEYVWPPIMTVGGKILEDGTPLVSMDSGYWKKNVSSCKFALLAAGEKLKAALHNYDRSKKLLARSKVVSERDYEIDKTAYFSALSAYMLANANLYQAKKQLDMCCLHSSVEGIVTNVFLQPGDVLAGEPVVLEVTQLNPIGVKVSLPDDVIDKLTLNATVEVTDGNDVKNRPVLGNLLMIDGNIVTFSVANYPVYKNTITILGKKLPVVDSFYKVSQFYIYKDDNTLGVPLDALKKDSKGTYVWKVKFINRNVFTTFRIPVVNVDKVYVVPGKEERLQGGHTEVLALQKSGNLQINDIVVMDKDVTLKENEEACLVNNRYQLMPGEQVDLKIISY
jgi:multidrug efflux pump subunit AcrA (membrane-fusion protein)